MRNNAVLRFMSCLVAGSVVAILLGSYLDKMFHTTPFIMLVLLLYVIIGSLYQLIKQAGE